jgi:hypothetical protein
MVSHKQTIELPLSLALDISGSLQNTATRSRYAKTRGKAASMLVALRARMPKAQMEGANKHITTGAGK